MSDSNSPVKVDVGVKLQGSLTPGWKSLDKVRDTIARGIGAVGAPALKVANALADSAVRLIEDSTDAALASRATKRLLMSEMRRQTNIESISAKAAAQLPETVSPEQVDPDWATRFVNAAQDASDQQLQDVWARLLASEIKQPGSISRRTLSVVNDLDPRDARLFAKVASLAWRRSDGHPEAWVFVTKHFGLVGSPREPGELSPAVLAECLRLVDAGLLQTASPIEWCAPWGSVWLLGQHTLSVREYRHDGGLRAFNARLDGETYTPNPEEVEAERTAGAQIGTVWPLSVAGTELLRVCDQDPPSDYLDAIIIRRTDYVRASWRPASRRG